MSIVFGMYKSLDVTCIQGEVSRSKYSEKLKYSESVAKTVKVIVLPYYYSVLQVQLGTCGGRCLLNGT
jgi:hypothetical protein